MAETIPDDFVNAQYEEGGGGGGGEQEGAMTEFVEGQYDDQQVVPTSWVCEYCEVENGLDTTECLGCGYDYAAADVVRNVCVFVCFCYLTLLDVYVNQGYTDEMGIYHDSSGGWYDENGE